MKIYTKNSEIKQAISELKDRNHLIGFVPTMGVLHQGHSSLIMKSKQECDSTVVSIFVNPTQFNNKNDFEKYPKTTEEDIALLESLGCDILFLPEKEEIYAPDYQAPKIDLGELNSIMEGKFRPGHFDGVIQVVYRLFDLVKPQKAYFGLKDFQQLAVIRKMTDHFNLPIEIIPCVTVREKDGLALSSRNVRLTEIQRVEALFIYESLILVQHLAHKMSPEELKEQIRNLYKESSLELEYIEFVDSESFEILEEKWSPNAVACIVAYVGEVRLIDNMRVFS